MIFKNSLKIQPGLKPLGARFNLVPLVDVIFIFVLFMMLSSSFIPLSGIKVSLPQGVGENFMLPKNIVTIQRDGALYFNDHPVNEESLKRNLLKLKNIEVKNSQKESATVVIRADEMTSYNKIVEMIDLVTRYKLTPILVTVQPNHPIELSTEKVDE